ncbi:hypothetical protein EAE96_007593 [Botrytis aclada]|nr:hypothetical protein EAE96_007593 [Botrytis aclada]
MPKSIETLLTERSSEKEIQCVYGKLIQDDEDFRATYRYVLAGRGASPENHPAAWIEPTLQSVSSLGSLSQPGFSRIFVGSYICHNCNLIYEVPHTPPRFDFIDTRTNLPIPSINMTKFVYFRYHCLPAKELRETSPPLIGRRPKDQAFENYRRSIETFLNDIGDQTIERARRITSMIVLANVMSEEFKRRCRSTANHFQLEMFFYNSVTNDQLYYVFVNFWSAIDFRSLLVSDRLPRSPTEEDKWRHQLRNFTKMTFASVARDYLNTVCR